MAAKRRTIAPRGDERYIRRDATGRITVTPGMGDRGDRRR